MFDIWPDDKARFAEWRWQWLMNIARLGRPLSANITDDVVARMMPRPIPAMWVCIVPEKKP